MVENIGLNALIFQPHDGIGKGVDLYRQTMIVRRQLAYHQRHVFTDARMVA
ncbi:Uncharacterised protein [Salmonella enterica subsp. enterica serovar Bovismorbificans]|nr:Uncharacterised protein [Salmonella enterica subsp. enterica serovar Bovismorbificans]